MAIYEKIDGQIEAVLFRGFEKDREVFSESPQWLLLAIMIGNLRIQSPRSYVNPIHLLESDSTTLMLNNDTKVEKNSYIVKEQGRLFAYTAKEFEKLYIKIG